MLDFYVIEHVPFSAFIVRVDSEHKTRVFNPVLFSVGPELILGAST